MIYKKIIKHGQKYFTDLLLSTHMHCGECGEDTNGDNFIRLRVVTPYAISLNTSIEDDELRIEFITGEGVPYFINLYNQHIATEMPGFGINMITGDDGVRTMEDMEQTSIAKLGIIWRNNAVYFGFENVTLDSYANGYDLTCPNCENSEHTTSAGIEIGVMGIDTISKIREGYSDENDIGLNLDDVSIMISLVNIKGEPISTPKGDMIPNTDTRGAFSRFTELTEIISSVPEW